MDFLSHLGKVLKDSPSNLMKIKSRENIWDDLIDGNQNTVMYYTQY